MTDAQKVQVTLDKAAGLERRLTVRVPAEQIEQQVDARLKKVGLTVKLKGFRPGKVPAKVVRQRFGAEVRQEVLSDIIRRSYSEAISQQKLRPAGGPAIEPLPDDGKHFGYRAVFEVYPEIEVGDLARLSIERPDVEILESDIDDMIEKLRLQRAEWREVERAAQHGDRIVVDFMGRIGGEPFAGSEGKDVGVVIGEGQVIADFEKALEGLAAGRTKTAKVKFPKDYANETLAGQKAEFEITAHRVEERVLPEVDAAFMEAFGITAGGIDALRAEVRGNMQRELNERLRAEIKTRTLDALLAATTIDVPKALVRDEIGNLQAAAMQRMGITDPQQAPAPAQFEGLARRRVALGLIVERLITAHDMTLDRDRVDARIRELAAPYDKPEEAVYVYRTNRDLMAQVESSVLEDQVVDLVLEKAKTKSKKQAFEEFMRPRQA